MGDLVSKMSRIDKLLTQIRDAPPERDLSQLEAEVWRRIDGSADSALNGWFRALPVATTACALALGFATAMISAPGLPSWDEMAVFSADAPLAPSTRLAKQG